ncbi:MAG: isochorismatase family protein [Steroidobacteraceae bacterium]
MLEFGARPALIVIDFVRAYVTPGSPLCADFEAARQASRQLLAASRKAGILVVHTNLAYQAGGADGGVFFRKLPALRCFAPGADPKLSEFVTDLEPLPDELVITKQYASAFFGTSLASTLTARRIDTLLISGVTTSGCIRATAVDCCQHGFIPVVVRDAVGDRAAAQHEANLFDLQAKYAEVISLARAQAYLASLDKAP